METIPVSTLLTVIGISVTVLLFIAGTLVGALRWLIDRSTHHLDEKLVGLEGSLQKQAAELREMYIGEQRELQRVERELQALKAELPQRFVSREDWIRFDQSVASKIDKLHEKLDALITQGGRRG